MNGDCDEPGPGDAHCSERYMHNHSCYSGSRDVSWNHRQDFVHDHADCPDDGLVNEGD